MNLLSQVITAAVASGTVSGQLKLPAAPRNLVAQFNLVYGSGGTSIDAYLQTSLDGGATWIDIANFHGTTSSARKVINLNGQTPQTTQISPSDGSMSSNSAQDGILGPIFRVKYQSVGTYGGNTTLSVDVSTDQAA